MTDNDFTFSTYTYNADSGDIVGVVAASTVFTFVRKPEKLRVDDKKNWRIRHSGSKRYPKARNRKRFTVKYTLEGMLAQSSFSELRRMALYDERSWLIDGPPVLNNISEGNDKPVVAMTGLSHRWEEPTDTDRNWLIRYSLILERVAPNASNHFRS